MSKNRRGKAGNNSSSIVEETNSQKKCRYCQESIHKDAKVCYHCSGHQNWFGQHVGNSAFLISVVMVFIAWLELCDARRERITAENASQTAVEAKKAAVTAQQQTEGAYSRIKEVVRTLTAITYFNGVTRNEVGTERVQEAQHQIEQELNALLKQMVPDPNERTTFIQDLNARLPKRE